MSLELFHKVPAGAIETLFNDQDQPLFKRANLGKYLGIEDKGHNFKVFPSHYTHPRSGLEAGGQATSLRKTKNPHDIFINLDGSIEMYVLTTCCASLKRIERRPTHITLFSVNIDSLKNIKNVLNFVTQA